MPRPMESAAAIDEIMYDRDRESECESERRCMRVRVWVGVRASALSPGGLAGVRGGDRRLGEPHPPIDGV